MLTIGGVLVVFSWGMVSELICAPWNPSSSLGGGVEKNRDQQGVQHWVPEINFQVGMTRGA